MARSNLTLADLEFCARRTGVEEVHVAPSTFRGKKGRMGTVKGVTRHHTGTPHSFKPKEDYPTYSVVKQGRPGLENSLSAFGLGRHRGIYVFSEFLSWHTGEWYWRGISDGNGHFLGIEAEGMGELWTPFQREFYPRLVASVLDFIDEGDDWMPTHGQGALPKGRKDDARNLWSTFDREVAGYLADPRTIGKTQTLEEVMQDVASLKFVYSPEEPNTWWLTNGMERRLMLPGEPETMMSLGLAEPHRMDTKETAAAISSVYINRMPIMENSGWLEGQGLYRTAPVGTAPTATEIAAAVAAALPATAGGRAPTVTEIATAVLDAQSERLKA